jgi:hypothetical protein
MENEKKEKPLEKALKYLPLAAVVLQVILLFGPDSFSDKKINYLVTVLKALNFEILFIALSIMFYYNYAWIKTKMTALLTSKTNILFFLFTIVIIILINFKTVYSLLKIRFVFYKVAKFYQHDLYQAAKENLKEGDYIKAKSVLDEISTTYPEQRYKLHYYTAYINEFMSGADRVYPVGTATSDIITGQSISREKLIKLEIAYSKWPKDDYREQLHSAQDLLLKKLPDAVAFYNAVKKDDQAGSMNLFKANGWYFFEDHLVNSIKRDKDSFQHIRALLSIKTENDFINDIKTSWGLDKIAGLIAWRPSA